MQCREVVLEILVETSEPVGKIMRTRCIQLSTNVGKTTLFEDVKAIRVLKVKADGKR